VIMPSPRAAPVSALPLLLLAAAAAAPPLNCTAVGEALCSADGQCATFGVLGTQIQLHGCAVVVPNNDWEIFARDAAGGGYSRVPGSVNVNESACAAHPNSGMVHSCAPPLSPPLYTKVGAVEVHTNENTVFYFAGRLYNVENIACGFPDHAGVYWPSVWGNHSYARIRDFATGVVVSNVTSTIGFGFVSAFVDYDESSGPSSLGTVWLFGTPADRCHGNGNAQTVQAWWSTDLLAWQTQQAFDLGAHTYNVQVTKVGALGGARPAEREAWRARREAGRAAALLPPHRYAMFLECFHFAINNNDDGNLTHGWTLLPNTTAPPGGQCGGPSFAYSPADDFYYILTGGKTVLLFRTQDFVTWEAPAIAPFIAPSAGDGLVSPFQSFAARAALEGSPPAEHVGVPEQAPFVPFEPVWRENWASWARNSNDADFCCMHTDVAESIVIWGASTQGGPPLPPLTGTSAQSNSVGTAPMPLVALLAAYFNSSEA
jgi:hypothetical protein